MSDYTDLLLIAVKKDAEIARLKAENEALRELGRAVVDDAIENGIRLNSIGALRKGLRK